MYISKILKQKGCVKKKKRKTRRPSDEDFSDEDLHDPLPNSTEKEGKNTRPHSVKNWTRETNNWYVRPAQAIKLVMRLKHVQR